MVSKLASVYLPIKEKYLMDSHNRSFFRIDVMMPCSYRILSLEEAVESPLPPIADASFIEKHFMESIANWDNQLNEIITQIGQKSSILANALSILNNKVNFIMQTIDEKQLSKTIPQQLVNVSASGLAIKVDVAVKQTDKVDLLIQPLKDEEPMLLRCNIVKIIPESDGQNTIALEYQNITEDDRRKLVFFIQSKEIEYALQQKEANKAKNK